MRSILNFENTYIRRAWMLGWRVCLHRLSMCSTLDYSYMDGMIVGAEFHCRTMSVFEFTLVVGGDLT